MNWLKTSLGFYERPAASTGAFSIQICFEKSRDSQLLYYAFTSLMSGAASGGVLFFLFFLFFFVVSSVTYGDDDNTPTPLW